MDFNELIDRNSEEFVRDLKITFFDVAAKKQMIMDRIELALSQETDQNRIESLQRLWADCHDAVKGCINGIYLVSTSLKQLEECDYVYDALFTENIEPVIVQEAPQNKSVDAIVEAPIVEEAENVSTAEPTMLPPIVAEEVSPTIEKEAVTVEEPTMLPPIVAEAPATEESVPAEEPTLMPSITLVENAPIEELEPTTPEPSIVQTEEVPTEVLEEPKLVSSEEVPVDNTEEENKPIIIESANLPEIAIVPSSMFDAPVEEPTLVSSEEVSEKEVPAEEPVTLEPIETPVEEEKTEEVINQEVEEEKSEPTVTTIEVEASPSLEEDIPPVLDKKDEQAPDKGSLLPLMEEVKEEEKNPEPEKKGLLELAPEPEKQKEENKDLETFVKESSADGKAILVTKGQAQKLRYSKDLQSSLFHSIHPVSRKEENVEEDVTEEQLEKMVEQLSSLYEQGKVEEAEEMSDRISVLSKKLKSAA